LLRCLTAQHWKHPEEAAKVGDEALKALEESIIGHNYRITSVALLKIAQVLEQNGESAVVKISASRPLRGQLLHCGGMKPELIFCFRGGFSPNVAKGFAEALACDQGSADGFSRRIWPS
jgi:hypothetical protein